MTEFKTSLGDIVKQKAAWTIHKESLSQKRRRAKKSEVSPYACVNSIKISPYFLYSKATTRC